MGFRIKIQGEIPEGAETSSVRARFSPDAAEDVQGEGYGVRGLAQSEDDAEGQGARGTWLKPAEDEDAEGQGIRGGWLNPVEDEDAEGQGIRAGYLKPVDDEDAEGQGIRGSMMQRSVDNMKALMEGET